MAPEGGRDAEGGAVPAQPGGWQVHGGMRGTESLAAQHSTAWLSRPRSTSTASSQTKRSPWPDPPQKARWQELVSYWAEIIHKLALPIGTVLATIVGTWLTMRISEENNLRDTINQREQAESSLRSSMFKELVAPLLTPTGASDAGAAADATLRSDSRYLRSCWRSTFTSISSSARSCCMSTICRTRAPRIGDACRSVARRVVSRQLAVLGEPSTEDKLANCKASSEDTEIWLRSDASEPDEGVLACTESGH